MARIFIKQLIYFGKFTVLKPGYDSVSAGCRGGGRFESGPFYVRLEK